MRYASALYFAPFCCSCPSFKGMTHASNNEDETDEDEDEGDEDDP